MSPVRVSRTAAACLALIALLASFGRASAQDAKRHATVDLGTRYDFAGGDVWARLTPGVAVTELTTLWSGVDDTHRLVLRYGSSAGVTDRPKTRTGFASSLLLPGRYSIWAAPAGEWSVRHAGVVLPEVRAGASALAWRGDTTAYRVNLSGGAEVHARSGWNLALHVTRALNALGRTNRERVLRALGGPGLWATSMDTAAGFTAAPGVTVFAAFGAYLGDSKFHVPPDARTIYSLGIRKALGAATDR